MRTLLDVTNNTEAEKDAPARDKDKTPEIVLSCMFIAWLFR
jgi:hypothetical protein